MHRKLFSMILLSALVGFPMLSQEKISADFSRAPRIQRYEISMRFDFSKRSLSAHCAMEIKNSGNEKLSWIPLSLYPGLRVTRVTGPDGTTPLPFNQGIKPYGDFNKLKVNFIRISLESPLAPQASITVIIDYRGHLGGYVHTGMRYIKDHIDPQYTIIRPDCKAYPGVETLSIIGNRSRGLPDFDYRVSVTVPQHLIVANGGGLENKSLHADGTCTYTYVNYRPAWRMDFSIAEYEILEDNARGLRVFCFPENRAGGLRVLASAGKAISLLNKWFGKPAEMPGFSIIQVPEGYGSQADVTSILQTSDVFLNKKQSVQLYHECSHLWNPPHLDPVPSRLESEGLAMFLQYLLQREIEGRTDALEQGFSRSRKRFLRTLKTHPDAGDIPLSQLGNRMQTGMAYSKGMTFFTILYRLMGEQDFIRGYGRFIKKYFSSGATLDQFLQVMQKSTPVDLREFFLHWIHSGAESTRLLRAKESSTAIAELYSPQPLKS